jgi:hypothetical protein
MFKISPKTIVLGGLAIAAAAGALKNRDKVAGLIGARSSAPEPPRPEPVRPPAPSNYDVSGPVANTATKVPAPEAAVLDEDGGIDERAEEEAAAAEAAAIGGAAPEYPGLSLDEEADEAERPVVEAGGGESEGEELAEFDLVDEAEPRAGERSDAEVQIDEAIEAQDNPTTGESIEAIETAEADAESEDSELEAATADDADDGPTSTAKDDDDPSNDGVRVTGAGGESPGSNGGGAAKQSTFGFAGGKVGAEEPEPEAADEPEAKASEEDEGEDDGPVIHPDQTSLLEDSEDAPKEKSAAEKSSAVWEPPKSPSSEGKDDDEEGGSEWQTWSGRAIRP